MALFKIEKGLAANLAANRPNANEGWAYFTTDDGKFYIDIAGDGTNSYPVMSNGQPTGRRVCLNAATADKVANKLIIKINDTNASSEGLNKFSYDGSNYTSHGSTADVNITLLVDDGIGISTPAQGSVLLTNTGVTSITFNNTNSSTGTVDITGTKLFGSTAIGGPSIPVYWTGTTFAATTGIQGSSTMTIRRWTT